MKSVCTKIWKFSWCLDSLEFIKNSREFSRNFTSRSRSRGIFISLFTLGLDLETFSFHFSLSISISRHFHFTFHSRNWWTTFLFHFSLLEMSESDFHFTFHFSNFQYPLSQDTEIHPPEVKMILPGWQCVRCSRNWLSENSRGHFNGWQSCLQ